jgi:copper oxidase (laccase) domain-containing protein
MRCSIFDSFFREKVMKNTHTGNIAAVHADGWKCLGTKLRADAEFTAKTLTFEKIRVRLGPNAGGQLQFVSGRAVSPTSNTSSNYIQPGEERLYTQVNLDLCWYNATDVDTTFEWDGNPQ